MLSAIKRSDFSITRQGQRQDNKATVISMFCSVFGCWHNFLEVKKRKKKSQMRNKIELQDYNFWLNLRLNGCKIRQFKLKNKKKKNFHHLHQRKPLLVTTSYDTYTFCLKKKHCPKYSSFPHLFFHNITVTSY